jgi:hypothetical protein
LIDFELTRGTKENKARTDAHNIAGFGTLQHWDTIGGYLFERENNL